MRVQSTLGLLILGSLVACAAPKGSSARAAADGTNATSSGEAGAKGEAGRASTAAPGSGPGTATPAPNTSLASLTDAVLARKDLEAYHGWIRYLMFRATHDGERFGEGSEAARRAHTELDTWTRRVLGDNDTLAQMRGVFEWAYLSPVDGSGQPFRLSVPTDYDPAHPAPLVIHMHGLAGNHIEHSSFMKDHPGEFEVAVLGRSRGGYYRALSEADVLGVIDYVEAHYSIDPRRVHLKGGSMGGGGTFFLGSRYPWRFASGRPICGFASDLPIANLLTVPLYATHSTDDPVVPVLQSRGPIGRLRELGGDAVLDETTGYGHAVWDYTEGNQRGDAWYGKHVLPLSSEVKRLAFTAIDGRATRDYWGEIVEWGPRPQPASFTLEARPNNTLAATTSNVAALAIRVSESPLDPKRALALSIDGTQLARKAPLPERLLLVKAGSGWAFAEESPAPGTRLHTPGGANQLYDGEPLLIVYGTQAASDVNAALRQAAVVASRSSNASWPSPSGDAGDDGISHNQNLYGELNVAADVDVTPEQIASRHLVLIGTAEQNSLVARMAERLPVRYDGEAIRFSDGTSLPAADTALGLVHYDPLAPSRLVFWVASPEAAAYRADALVPRTLGRFPTGVDLVVTRVSEPRILLARSFDSRWNWVSREGSPALPAAGAERAGFARMLAESVRRVSGADFALALESGEDGPTYATGSMRTSDFVGLLYYEPIAVMSLTGSELAAARLGLAKNAQAHLQPEPNAKLDPKRSYRLALTARQLGPLFYATHLAPPSYRLTELELASTLARSGFATP
jgi:hypothetical protein